MTKKDYQAIAGALFGIAPGFIHPNEWEGGLSERQIQWKKDVDAIAAVLAADNPRFDRETFVLACETGDVTRRPKRKSHIPPRCALAMGCLCAGHARGNPASEPCDTTE